MVEIIDASVKCDRKARDLMAAGVRTVIRYYTRDSRPDHPKRLHREEALALAVAGLRIGVVYEGRRGNQIDNFDRATGSKDGAYARNYAHGVIGQPEGSTIYFGIDTDVEKAAMRDRVIPYFEGVVEAFAAETGESRYEIGVYGSGLVCRTLLDAGLAKHTWLAQSKGWAEYASFEASGRWSILQQMPTQIAGLSCDPDVAGKGDIGDFALPVAAQAIATREKFVNARSGLHLRAGPGVDFESRRLLPFGMRVHQIGTSESWSLLDLEGDGAADGYVSSGYLVDDAPNTPGTPIVAASLLPLPNGAAAHDHECIPTLIERGSSAEGLAAARKEARAALPGYPHNGCAAHLSALLRQSGIEVPMTVGAGKLAWRLEQRGWQRVARGLQKPGDVGVAYDTKPPEGSDHVYLVVALIDGDAMMIADNQNGSKNAPHERYASGHDKTATDYFLRAV